jgi:hypothetical protein
MGWIRMISSLPRRRWEIEWGADRVVGDDAACVSNHVRIAFAQTEGLFGLQ